MKKAVFAAAFISLFCVSFSAQTPTPTPISGDGEVVKISTTLIQLDVVVTDKNGNQVTDLRPEDFEIFENGEKQSISNFSYFSADKNEKTSASAPPKITDKFAPPVPIRLTADQVRRTIAIVVDDLGMNFGGIDAVKSALKKYVEKQMQPGDLVAIIRTSGGIGALQQFTTDKRLLYAAIEKIRWQSHGRGRVGDFAPIEPTFREMLNNRTEVGQKPSAESITTVTSAQVKAEREFMNETQARQDDIFTAGSLGAVGYVVRGMRDLPGRKSILLYSNGFVLVERNSSGRAISNARVQDGMRGLVDLANRSSVAIYTADARGLVGIGLTAEDNTSGLNNEQVETQLEERRTELRDTQDGLRFLANETGGRAFLNNNDLNAMITKTLSEQAGYYLIGYQPDADIFNPQERKFNKISVKVNRPDLRVRYRSGFFGVSNEENLQKQISGSRQMIQAITSPFNAVDIGLRINSIYLNDPTAGSLIKSYMFMPGKDVKFKDDADGWKTASFEVLAILFGDNGVAAEQMNRVYTLRIKNEEYDKILTDGLVYSFEFPVTKHGAYQLRIVLRDNENSKVGSASQFVEIPNFKKRRVNLSGIALENFTQTEWSQIMQNQPANNSSSLKNYLYDSQRDSSQRRYKRNSVLNYSYYVYNPKTGDKLKTQMRLFRNGELVFEGNPKLLSATNQSDLQRIPNTGAMVLGSQLSAGDYVLQILVTDELAKEKYKVASQWIDFEIIE